MVISHSYVGAKSHRHTSGKVVDVVSPRWSKAGVRWENGDVSPTNRGKDTFQTREDLRNQAWHRLTNILGIWTCCGTSNETSFDLTGPDGSRLQTSEFWHGTHRNSQNLTNTAGLAPNLRTNVSRVYHMFFPKILWREKFQPWLI